MAKTKKQPSSGEDNKGSIFDPGDTTEGRDWVYSATQGTVSDINWINHWKQMRARWHPDYLFGGRHGARVYRYWDEDYMNSDYIVAVDADVEVPYYPYPYPIYNQSTSATEKSEYHYGRDRRPFPWFCILLVIILGAAITIPVIFAIILSTSKPESPTDILGRIRSELTLVKIRYSPELANTSSPEFQFLVSEFEKEMGLLYDANSTKEQYAGSRVNSVTFDKNGSAKVSYDLFFDVKEMRIPTHQTLKEILYSVDRDKTDKGLGVLGELRFRIESYKVVDSKVVKRVDVNDTVTGLQDNIVPSTKVLNASKTESDPKEPAIKGTDRFVPNIIVKKQPNIITHKIIVKTVKPVAIDWDKLRNRGVVKDSIITSHHDTLQTTTQDIPTAKSTWPPRDAIETIPSDFITLTNTRRAQTRTMARLSSTTTMIPTTVSLVTGTSSGQSSRTVFPDLSSQRIKEAVRTTATWVTNKKSKNPLTYTTRLEYSIEDMPRSFTDSVSTNSDSTKVFVTKVASKAQRTGTTGSTFTSNASSVVETNTSLQPELKTFNFTISASTAEKTISTTDRMKDSGITPLMNDDEELKAINESKVQHVQGKTPLSATITIPTSQNTGFAKPASYSSTLSPSYDATVLVILSDFTTEPVTNHTQHASTLDTQDIASAGVFPKLSVSEFTRKLTSATTQESTSFSQTEPSWEVQTTINTESPADTALGLSYVAVSERQTTKTMKLNSGTISANPTTYAWINNVISTSPTQKSSRFSEALTTTTDPRNFLSTEHLTGVAGQQPTTTQPFIRKTSSTGSNDIATLNQDHSKSITLSHLSQSDAFPFPASTLIPLSVSYSGQATDTREQNFTTGKSISIKTPQTTSKGIPLRTGEINSGSTASFNRPFPAGRAMTLPSLITPEETSSDTLEQKTTNIKSETTVSTSTTKATARTSSIYTKASAPFVESRTSTGPSGATATEQVTTLDSKLASTDKQTSMFVPSTTQKIFTVPSEAHTGVLLGTTTAKLGIRNESFKESQAISGSAATQTRTITETMSQNFSLSTQTPSIPFNSKTVFPEVSFSKSEGIIGRADTEKDSIPLIVESQLNVTAPSTSVGSDGGNNNETSATHLHEVADLALSTNTVARTSFRSIPATVSAINGRFPISKPTISPFTIWITNKSKATTKTPIKTSIESFTINASLVTNTTPQLSEASTLDLPQISDVPPTIKTESMTSVTEKGTAIQDFTETENHTNGTSNNVSNVAISSYEVQTSSTMPLQSTISSQSFASTTPSVSYRTSAASESETTTTAQKPIVSETTLTSITETAAQSSEFQLPLPTEIVPTSSLKAKKTFETIQTTDWSVTGELLKILSAEATPTVPRERLELRTEPTTNFQLLSSEKTSTRGFTPSTVLSEGTSESPAFQLFTTLSSVFPIATQTPTLAVSRRRNETQKDASTVSKESTESPMIFTNESQMTLMNGLTLLAISSFNISSLTLNATTTDRMEDESWLNFLTAVLNVISSFDDQNIKEIQKALLYPRLDLPMTKSHITKDANNSTSSLNLLLTILNIPSSFNAQNKYKVRKILYPLLFGTSKIENLTNNDTHLFSLLKVILNFMTLSDRNYIETRDMSLKLLSDLSRIGNLTAKERDTFTSRLKLLMAIFNLTTPFHGQNVTEIRKLLFPVQSDTSRVGNLTITDGETSMSRLLHNLVTSFDDKNNSKRRDMLFPFPAELLRDGNRTTRDKDMKISRPKIRMVVIKFITQLDGYNNTETRDILFPLLLNLSTEENLTAKNEDTNMSRIELLTDLLNIVSILNGQNQTETRDRLIKLLSGLSIMGKLTRNDTNTNTSLLHQLVEIIQFISAIDGGNTTETRDILLPLPSHLSRAGNLTAKAEQTNIFRIRLLKAILNILSSLSGLNDTETRNIIFPVLSHLYRVGTQTGKDADTSLLRLHLLMGVLKLITPMDIQNKTKTRDIIFSLFSYLAKDENLTTKDRETSMSRLRPLIEVINFIDLFEPTDSRNDTETGNILFQLLSALSRKGNLTSQEREMDTYMLNLLMAILNLITPTDGQNNAEVKDVLFSLQSNLPNLGNLTGQDEETNMSRPNLLLGILNLMTQFIPRNDTETRDLFFPLPPTFSRAGTQTIQDRKAQMARLNLLMAISNSMAKFYERNNTEIRDSYPFLFDPLRVGNLTRKAGETYMSRDKLLTVILNVISPFKGENDTDRYALLQLLSDLSKVEDLAKNRDKNTSRLNLLTAIFNLITQFEDPDLTQARSILLSLLSDLSRLRNMTDGETILSRLKLLGVIPNIILSLNGLNNTEIADTLFQFLIGLPKVGNLTRQNGEVNISSLNLLMNFLNLTARFYGRDNTENRDVLFPLLSALSRVGDLTMKNGETNKSKFDVLMNILHLMTHFDRRNTTEVRDIFLPLFIDSLKEGNQTTNNRKTSTSKLNLLMAIINSVTPFDDRNSSETTNMLFKSLSYLPKKGNLTTIDEVTNPSGFNSLMAILNLITTLSGRTTLEEENALFSSMTDMPRTRNLTTMDEEMTKSRLNLLLAIIHLLTPFYGQNTTETRDLQFRSLSDVWRVSIAKDGQQNTSRLKLSPSIQNLTSSFHGRNSTEPRNVLFPSTPNLHSMENLITRDGMLNASKQITTILNIISSLERRNNTDSNQTFFSFKHDLTRPENLITKDDSGNTSNRKLQLAILKSGPTFDTKNNSKTRDILFLSTPESASTGNMTMKGLVRNTPRINLRKATLNLSSAFSGRNKTQTRTMLSKLLTSFSNEAKHPSPKGGEMDASMLNLLTAIFNIMSSDGRTITEAVDILFKLTPLLLKTQNIAKNDRMTETSKINLLLTIFNLISSSYGKNDTEQRNMLFPLLSDSSRVENLITKDGMTNTSRSNLLKSILEIVSSIHGGNKTRIRNILLQLTSDIFIEKNLTKDDEQTYMSRLNILTTILTMITSLNDQNNTKTTDMLFPLIPDLFNAENLTIADGELNTAKLNLLMATLNLMSLSGYRNNTDAHNMFFLLMSDIIKAYNLIPKDEMTKISRHNLLNAIFIFMSSLVDRHNTENRDKLFPQSFYSLSAENLLTKYGKTNTPLIYLVTAIINMNTSFEGQNYTETLNKLMSLMPGLSGEESLIKEGVTNTSSLNLLAHAFKAASLIDSLNNTESRKILFQIMPNLNRAENLTIKDGETNMTSLRILSTVPNVFGGLNIGEIKNLLSHQTPDSFRAENATTKDEIASMSILNLLTAIFSTMPSFDSQKNTETRDILLQSRTNLSRSENLTTNDWKKNTSNINLLRAVINIMSSFHGKNDSETKSQTHPLLANLSVVENLITRDGMTRASWIDLLIALRNLISLFDSRNHTEPSDVLFLLTPELSRAQNLTNKGGMMNTSRFDLLTAILRIIISLVDRNDTNTAHSPFSLLADILRVENLTANGRETNSSRLDLRTAILKIMSSFDGHIDTETNNNFVLSRVGDLIKNDGVTNTSRLNLLTTVLNKISFIVRNSTKPNDLLFESTPDSAEVEKPITQDGTTNTSSTNLLMAILNDLSRTENKTMVNREKNKFMFDVNILRQLLLLTGKNHTKTRQALLSFMPSLSREGNLTTGERETNTSRIKLLTSILKILSSFSGTNNSDIPEISIPLTLDLSVAENFKRENGMDNTSRVNILPLFLNLLPSFGAHNYTNTRSILFMLTPDSSREQKPVGKYASTSMSEINLLSFILNTMLTDRNNTDKKELFFQSTPEFSIAKNLITKDELKNRSVLNLVTDILNKTTFDWQNNTESRNVLLKLMSDLSMAENINTEERPANSLDRLTSILNLTTFDGHNNTETVNVFFLLMPDLSGAEHLVTKNQFANLLSSILDLISSFDGQNNTKSRNTSFPLASDLSKIENLITEDVVANMSVRNLLTAIQSLLSSFDSRNNTETRNILYPLYPDLIRAENLTRKDGANISGINFYSAAIDIMSPFYDRNNTDAKNILLPLLSDLSLVKSVITKDGMTNTSSINQLRTFVNFIQSLGTGKYTELKDMLLPLTSDLSRTENPVRTDEEDTSSLGLPAAMFNITSSLHTENITKEIDILFPLDLSNKKDNITNGELLKITENDTIGKNTTLIVRPKTAKILNPSFEYLWSLGDNVLDTLLGSQKTFKTPDKAWDSDHLSGLNNSSVIRGGLSKSNRARFQTVNQDDIKPIEADILPDFDGSITGNGVAITIGQGFTTDFNSDIKTVRPFTIVEGRNDLASNTSISSVGVPLSLGTPGLLSFPNTATVPSETTHTPTDTESEFMTQPPFKGDNMPGTRFPILSDLQIQILAETGRDTPSMSGSNSANVMVTAQPSNLKDKEVPTMRETTSDMRSDNLLNLSGLDGVFEILGNSDKLLKTAVKPNISRKNIISKVAVNNAATGTKRGNPKDDNVRGTRLISNDNLGFFGNFLNMNTDDIFQPSENMQQVSIIQNSTAKNRGQDFVNINSLLSNDRSNIVSNLLSPANMGFMNEANIPILSEFSSQFNSDKTGISENGPEAQNNASSLSESLAAFDISNFLGTDVRNSNHAKETNLTSRSNASKQDSDITIVATSLKNNARKVGDETHLVSTENPASSKTISTVETMIQNVANNYNLTDIANVSATQFNGTGNVEATELNGISSKLELVANQTGIPTELRKNTVENFVNEVSAVREIEPSPVNYTDEDNLNTIATSNTSFATNNRINDNNLFSSKSPELVSIHLTAPDINVEAVNATTDGFRNVTEEFKSTSDTTAASETVFPIVDTSSWTNISINLAAQKNGTINGTSGEIAEETTINIRELQFELSQRAFIGYPTTLQWKMFFIRGWKFIIVQKEMTDSPPLIIGVVTEQSRIPSRGFSSLTISQDSVFGEDSALIYLDIPSVVCDDEGTYTVRVLDSPEIVLSERRDFVQVFDVPIVQAIVPDNLFENAKSVDPYCVASLGYPAGRLFLQIQYPTEDRFETFMSSSILENITLQEPCRKIVRVSFGEYLNNTINLNSTIIRCGVVDTPAILNQDGVLFSATEKFNIIPDNVCGNSTTFTRHPFRPCHYIDCAKPEVVTCPRDTCFNSTSQICEPVNSLPVS